MNAAIVPFTMEAYGEVIALWKQCEGIGLSEADAPECIKAYLERNPVMSFVAIDGGTVVGAVLCGHDGRRGYLHHLAVHPKARRCSLGRRLVDRCFESLRMAGIRKCHIFVINENRDGMAFWTSVGWTPRGDISIVSKEV